MGYSSDKTAVDGLPKLRNRKKGEKRLKTKQWERFKKVIYKRDDVVTFLFVFSGNSDDYLFRVRKETNPSSDIRLTQIFNVLETI